MRPNSSLTLLFFSFVALFFAASNSFSQIPQVDLESLGLDNQQAKAAPQVQLSTLPIQNKEETKKEEKTKEIQKEKAVVKEKKEEVKPALAEKLVPKDNSKASVEAKQTKNLPDVTPKKSLIKKILSKLTSDEEEVSVQNEEKKEIETPEEKRIKAESRKRLEQQKKLKDKLEELREKYVQNKDIASPSGEFYSEHYHKIIPKEKDLNPFLVEDAPPPPLVSYNRSKDNMHVPFFLTLNDYIGIMFDSIISNINVALFNEAYRNVRNPNVRNTSGDTILTLSVLLQRYDVIASVLAKGADPNLPNNFGYTPLDIAIEMQDIKSIDLLIKHKANISLPDAFGSTYLIHATRTGLLPAVQLLVESGADVNAMDNEGFTALSMAYRYKHEVLVRYLIDQGAKTWIERPTRVKKRGNMIRELNYRWR